MLKLIKKTLLKQYNIGSAVGGLKDLAIRTMVYVTAINFLLLVVTAYSVTLRDFMIQYLPWINFPMFIGAIIVTILIAMVIEYKFILPSTWGFTNRQQYEHRNPIREDLSEIKERLTGIEEHLRIEGKK